MSNFLNLGNWDGTNAFKFAYHNRECYKMIFPLKHITVDKLTFNFANVIMC